MENIDKMREEFLHAVREWIHSVAPDVPDVLINSKFGEWFDNISEIVRERVA